MEKPKIEVLLVDDDEEEFALAKRFLAKSHAASFNVRWTPTVEEALAAMDGAAYDACLLDYQLGEQTGISLLEHMRHWGLDLPVILLTGKGSLELDLKAMDLGAFDYLEKGDLTPALLERSIRYAIENHRARAALQKANEALEQRVRERTAELDRSNRDLEQFANLVARDLQQPLEAIAREIEAIRARGQEGAGKPNWEVIYGLLDTVFLAVKNMGLFVQSVLDFSRVGKGAESFERVDLNAVANQVCAALQSVSDAAGATIETGPLPSVLGNRRLLQGLFVNLIDNAIKFRGKEPPRIQISSERKGDAWLCAVKDNGIGVPEEEIDEIFLMFTKGAAVTAYPGIGIGLAMCRKIIQCHGGKIWVDANPDGGSVFYLTLPAD